MPYSITWLVDKRVLYSKFDGDLSADGLKAFIDEIINKAETGEQPLYHISDSRKLGKVGLTLGGMRKLVSAYKVTNLLTWQIDINEKSLNRMIASIATQFAGLSSHSVRTLDEAVAFIKARDYFLEHAEWNLPQANDEKDDTLPYREPDTLD